MKKNYLVFISLLATISLSGCISPGKNSPILPSEKGHFPSIVGIDLHGVERTLPEAFEGTKNVVIVAFERHQQQDVNTWIPTIETLMIAYPSLRFYEVPLIYELSIFRRFFINNGMRRGIPDEVARERTITVYTNREQFTKLMDMNIKTIYTLLLNDKGEILWRTTGKASAENILALDSAITTHGNGL